MGKEIILPFSTMKKFLISSGMRANADAVRKFSQVVIEKSKELAEVCMQNARDAKRKTIYEGDITDTPISKKSVEEAVGVAEAEESKESEESGDESKSDKSVEEELDEEESEDEEESGDENEY